MDASNTAISNMTLHDLEALLSTSLPLTASTIAEATFSNVPASSIDDDGEPCAKHPKTTAKYECHLCNKSYCRKTHLQRHMLKHDGKALFMCELCDTPRPFYRRDHFEYHKRTHTGCRPFPCSRDGCTKTFRQRGALTRHMQSHAKRDMKKMSREAKANRHALPTVDRLPSSLGNGPSNDNNAALMALLSKAPLLEQDQLRQQQQQQQQRAYNPMFPLQPPSFSGFPTDLSGIAGLLPHNTGYFPASYSMPSSLISTGLKMPEDFDSMPSSTSSAAFAVPATATVETSSAPANAPTDKVQELVKLLLQCQSILRTSSVAPSAAPPSSFEVFNDEEAWAATRRLLAQ